MGKLTIELLNSRLIWEYRPNAKASYRGSPLIQTNRFGFRERDSITLQRPDGMYRIAFIGDSITLGLLEKNQDIFVRQFEDRVRMRQPNVQALNFGIDGYNAEQVYELLRWRVMNFQPSKVMYVMCLNDFDFYYASGDKIRYFREPKSFVLDEVARLLSPQFSWRTDEATLSSNVEYHKYYYGLNKEKVFANIVDMQTLLVANDVDFEVVIVPIFLFGNGNNFSHYPLQKMHLEIRQFLGTHNIQYLDLLNSFKDQYRGGDSFAYDVWHPNSAGHDYIATQLVLDFLKVIPSSLQTLPQH